MRDERRQQILSGALKLFTTKGLAATKIIDIAYESQISQGLMYHYFRSKEEIFVELIRGAFERMNAAMLAFEALPLTATDKIRKVIVEFLRVMEEDEDFARYFLVIAHAHLAQAIPAEARAIIETEGTVPYEVMTRIMRLGRKKEWSTSTMPRNSLWFSGPHSEDWPSTEPPMGRRSKPPMREF